MRRTPFKRKREAPTAPRSEHPKALTPATRTATYGGSTTGALPKEPEPVRDEGYRRWVASLPCFECRIEGYSQAAHANTGNAKGMKTSDETCFPMCATRPGRVGCHALFDLYLLVKREEMTAYEQRALEWTRQQLGAKA